MPSSVCVEEHSMVDQLNVADAHAPPPPLFCPKCTRAKAGRSDLCDECGETLLSQGFCSICERFWPHSPGEPCPKHDVPLEDDRHVEALGPSRIDWVTVAAFPQVSAAQTARIRLEAEAIPTFLEGERMNAQGAFAIATGGVRLQVPRDLADEARIVLSQTWIPADDDGLDDAFEDFGPHPGAKRRMVMKAIIVFFLLWPVIGFLIAALTS
jgi:hypothetical protein